MAILETESLTRRFGDFTAVDSLTISAESFAVVVKTRERFMGIGQVLTMPLFFASNAIYPIDIMPRWLRMAARVNPLTYEVDALRALMLAHGVSVYGLAVGFAVLVAAIAALIMVGAYAYPRVVT
jgi:ABC-2 type transport system permease protein